MAFAIAEVTGALIFVATLFYLTPVAQWIVSSVQTGNIPRVGSNPWFTGLKKARDEFYHNARAITGEGYQRVSGKSRLATDEGDRSQIINNSQFRRSMFRVQTVDMERIIISNAYADELRKLPESTLSLTEALCGRYLGWYTTLDVIRQSNLHVDVCHRNMASKLGPIVEGEMDEMQYACEAELPSAERSQQGFEYVEAYHKMFAIANQVVSRSLVGSEMCRNRTWLQSNLGYLWNVFMMARSLRRHSFLTRPFAYFWSRERGEVQKNLRQTRDTLTPMIRSRSPGDPNKDILQWMIDAGEKERGRPALLAQLLLVLSVAGINTTASAVTHNVFDLCAKPEVVPILRQEVEDALQRKGGWCLAALQEMTKLDSFARESSRMNFPGLFTFNRKILQETRLSDGRILPAGSYVAMPAGCVARDAEVYPAPDEFQPWRFEDLRKANPGEAGNRYQLSSTNKDNLLWGYGVSTCPGRMLAATHVKAMVAYLLLNYDMVLPEGSTTRPENVYEDERCIPRRNQKVGFKLRV